MRWCMIWRPVMSINELIEQRPRFSSQSHINNLYALRDSGIINMMEAHLPLAMNFFGIETQDGWGNFSSRTAQALESREQIEDALEIVKHWMKECEAGGQDHPSFDESDYEDSLECIGCCGY